MDPSRSSDAKAYFDYSFYELGKYDAPTQIDYVLKKTGHKKLSYVGHSQGTSQMFSALSEGHGNLQDKLNIFVAICPITNLHWADPPIGNLNKAVDDSLIALTKFNGIWELYGPGWSSIVQQVCAVFPCAAITQFFDSNPSDYNDPVRSDVSNYRTSPASSKQVIHYAQTQYTNDFIQYDYGADENLRRYGQKTPPFIALKSIKTPLAMFVGKQDPLSTPLANAWTKKELSEKPIYYKERDHWDHGTFSIGKDMSYLDDLFGLLSVYH